MTPTTMRLINYFKQLSALKMKSICTILMSVMLVGCSNLTPYKNGSLEIIYRAKNGSMVEVFNISKLFFSVEDYAYLTRRDFRYGEFGGQIGFCSNEKYSCLDGGIHVAIPKKIGEQSGWSFENKECSVARHEKGLNKFDIVCNFRNSSTSFVFVENVGIVSYIRSSNPSLEFELVGEKGLFAQ